jgi:hypothetical protein
MSFGLTRSPNRAPAAASGLPASSPRQVSGPSSSKQAMLSSAGSSARSESSFASWARVETNASFAPESARMWRVWPGVSVA